MGNGERTEVPPVAPTGTGWLRTVVIGFGCGLLFHRYALLPFGMGSISAHALSIIGFGLLVATRVGRGKGRRKAERWTAQMITLALVAAVGSVAVGFGLVPPLGYLSLRARGLPGFRLDLPRGDEDTFNSWHADAGEYRVKNLDGIGAGVEVQWGRGLANDEAWLVLIAKANALGIGIPRAEIRTVDDVVVPGSPQARSVIARRGSKQIWNTQVPCGSRSFVIATVGENWGTERLHRRIVATAHCLALLS